MASPYTHRIIRDRVSAAVSIIFGVYMGYLAHGDGVALGPSIFFGLIAFVILAVVLMVLRSFVYAVLIAALLVWLAARMGFGWADQLIAYIEQLCRLGYSESLKLFMSTDRNLTT
ncbi:hypothetical protein [Martelella endophytica]|uniref:Uncharacterized protein n=1 Tax=Martelella endophytica TaxID=1486262 RepID=A0A0D5LVJ2_MAREN|nr:hypothetical protein [Martelella endophytica]AJY47378.1 hypothetical protein TM49_19670 [Martelella endophytica]